MFRYLITQLVFHLVALIAPEMREAIAAAIDFAAAKGKAFADALIANAAETVQPKDGDTPEEGGENRVTQKGKNAPKSTAPNLHQVAVDYLRKQHPDLKEWEANLLVAIGFGARKEGKI